MEGTGGADGVTAVANGSERLEARGLKVHFGGVHAVDGVDLLLAKGEILGLIGPNGAGKTTLVNALTGFQKPTAGSVLVNGQDVTGLSPHRLARKGLARTFQSVRLFPGLTVLENVELGGVGVGMRRPAARKWARELLERLHLSDKAGLYGIGLPHGLERRLGIVRALAAKPTFLMLDEPAAGLNEQESDELVESLTLIRDDFACALVVIEHDMRLIMRLCERIQVLDYGKTISIGTPAQVRSDPAVLTAYLGRRAVDA
ncbi:MAG TPA: ABC transporter ATP-binding protein [Gaiellaceae bacterium]|jgi:branched-chain amino acid transport system ATP-binding protein|nr:ABC transporter ATP-binding protein [Gaiellaceae bacterium]